MRDELQDEKRIAILDGFRAIAIIFVVLFHYYACYDGVGTALNLYQYEPVYFFKYGHFGVPLFFTISGFVITHTLRHCTGIRDFLGKRYLRLLPAMAICSVITYAFQNYPDNREEFAALRDETPLDFLFSFTFIHQRVWNSLFSINSDMIDRAYWSLWAEVVFYVFASLVFFFSSRGSFVRNWLRLSLFIQAARILTSPRLETLTPDFLLPVSQSYYQAFMFLEFSWLVYFTAGVLFYALWSKQKVARLDYAICAVLFAFEMYFIKEPAIRILFVLLIALWCVFIYRPQWLKFLEWKPIVMVGLISYPLYLLHENAGLIISDWIVTMTKDFIPPVIVPVFVLILMLCVSYLIFTWFERPVMRSLRNYFIPKRTTK